MAETWYLATSLHEMPIMASYEEFLTSHDIRSLHDLMAAVVDGLDRNGQPYTQEAKDQIMQAAKVVWDWSAKTRRAKVYASKADNFFSAGGFSVLQKEGYKIYPNVDEKLDLSKLSARSRNSLLIAGKNTMRQLLGTTLRDLNMLRNIGMQTAFEIMLYWLETQHNLFSWNIETTVGEESDSASDGKVIVFLNRENGAPMDDKPLSWSEFNLNSGMLTALKEHNICYLSQYLATPTTTLSEMGIFSRSSGSFSSPRKYVRQYETYQIQRSELAEVLVPSMVKYFGRTESQWDSVIYSMERKSPKETSEDMLIACIYRWQPLREMVKAVICGIADNHLEGFNIKELGSVLPDHLTSSPELFAIFAEMVQAGHLCLDGTTLWAPVISPEKYIEAMPDGIHREVWIRIVKGMSISEIAEDLNRSRARIDQIVRRDIRGMKDPQNRWIYTVQKYESLLSRYHIKTADFLTMFPVSRVEYIVMRTIWGGRMKGFHYSMAVEDPEIPDDIKEVIRLKIAKETYPSPVTEILYHRNDAKEFVISVLKNRCKEAMCIDDFHRIYLEEASRQKKTPIVAARNMASFKSYLRKTGCVLISLHQEIRYFDRSQYDYQRLISALDLKKYHEGEQKATSTRTIYYDNLNLMEEYDIQNEHELHDLLRQIWPEYGNTPVQFNRMPHLIVTNDDSINK